MDINRDMALLHIKQGQLNSQVNRANAAMVNDEKAMYNKRLREACDGFEEIFIHKLLQTMRSSSPRETLLSGGRGEEIFQDMLDENYAKIISKSRSFGLGDLIYEQTKKD